MKLISVSRPTVNICNCWRKNKGSVCGRHTHLDYVPVKQYNMYSIYGLIIVSICILPCVRWLASWPPWCNRQGGVWDAGGHPGLLCCTTIHVTGSSFWSITSPRLPEAGHSAASQHEDDDVRCYRTDELTLSRSLEPHSFAMISWQLEHHQMIASRWLLFLYWRFKIQEIIFSDCGS